MIRPTAAVPALEPPSALDLARLAPLWRQDVAPPALQDALRATVAYADVFDFPLTGAEVHRDLIGHPAGPDRVAAAVADLVARRQLDRAGELITLPGRHRLADLRQRRRAVADRLWPVARRVGRALGALPFVRMVAVTGSLAADNPSADADLDYLVVAAPGRLWLARAFAIGLVRLAGAGGVRVCPNYLLTADALRLDRHDLYTAHELLQAVPVAGAATYRQLRALNPWTARWLPNRSRQLPSLPSDPPIDVAARRAAELLLGGPAGDRLEACERHRKQRRLAAAGRARFTDSVCEGHFGHNHLRARRSFDERCARLGIALPDALR